MCTCLQQKEFEEARAAKKDYDIQGIRVGFKS